MKIISVKFEDNISEFLGCDINIDRDKKDVLITQSGVINIIKRYFGNELNKMRKYSTTYEPNSHVVSPKMMFNVSVNSTEQLSVIIRDPYVSFKNSRPHLNNNVR